MIANVFNSTLARLRNRLNSPVFGAFILSWCVINWRTVIALFSGKEVGEDRIVLISKHLPTDGNAIWIPAYYAAQLLLITPILTLVFKLFSEFIQALGRIIKRKIDRWHWDRIYARLDSSGHLGEFTKKVWESLAKANKTVEDIDLFSHWYVLRLAQHKTGTDKAQLTEMGLYFAERIVMATPPPNVEKT